MRLNVTTSTVLYGPERHEPPAGDAWSEDAARAAVERWVSAALTDFDPACGRRAHPREDGGPPGEPLCEVYGGAGGAIWALEYLAQAGAVHQRWDFSSFLVGLAATASSATSTQRFAERPSSRPNCAMRSRRMRWRSCRPPLCATATA